MDIAIIGGGAAGFFAAISAKENYPEARVVIFEKSKEILTKVKISGGGRCNLTNACASVKELSEAYPRGGNALKKAFGTFNNQHTMHWFESRGVPLMVQDDQCVFPLSQNSQSVIDCFLEQTRKLKIELALEQGIKSIKKVGDKLQLGFVGGKLPAAAFDKVIVTIGGSQHREGLAWLEKLNHKIEEPAPSLFSFKVPDEAVTELMGVVVDNALVGVQGTKLKAEGPLLITHWGFSGPAILTLSSLGARVLSEKDYNFKLQVNWTDVRNNDEVVVALNSLIDEHPQKLLANLRPYALPERLWLYLLEKTGLQPAKKWAEIGKTGLNRLVNTLTNDVYAVKGRTQFRDEFVTCGGVSLESIDLNTMQSRVCENLYFAGEVMDIDGITGGFNFQAAWTTAFIAAKLN
ncbi:NAD(P)/FAD-dependent oxidoreductase [Geopsychrobacter electrodiphilus]|uniref:NAD(P)/FAD-dependent oxidoreductase n=1 Tax=Geopsychrobacter electrodiphilus TaxID=225196 RepID=UPI00037C6F79|nr:NAD(P)/FAD-dependent oxidoreductase [Geopsychrobacter electrodiphilus]